MAQVYKHTFKTSGKSYIGQTIKTMEERLKGHLYESSNGSSFQFHKAISKYGEDDIISEVLFETDVLFTDVESRLTNLDMVEMIKISEYDTFNNGYNMNKGGGGQFGFSFSDESRQKMRQSAKDNLIDGRRQQETIDKQYITKSKIGEDGLNSFQRAGYKSAETLGEEGCRARTEKAKQTSIETGSYEIIGQKNSEHAKRIEENGKTLGYNKAVKGRETRKLNPEKQKETGKKLSEKAKRKITCPHCGKEGNIANIKRWHYDNCKHYS